MTEHAKALDAAAVKAAALASRFALVGLARAEALDGGPLEAWLAAGHAADMDWMARRKDERLDPRRVLPGAKTVIALAIGYRRADLRAQSVSAPIARYARGRDYHYAHRDHMKTLRKRLLALAPGVETYACVDTGVAMEKVWAARAGLGWIGKNGCLINPRLGSWLTLSVMFMDRAVDVYDEPHDERCGACTLCLEGCPTEAFPAPGVVDARRCLSYQSIENRGEVPEPLRRGFRGRVFGCDVCQDVCPWNRFAKPGAALGEPSSLSLELSELAGLSPAEFKRRFGATPVSRAKRAGFLRNVLLAMGNAKDARFRPLLAGFVDDSDPVLREQALWSLARLPPDGASC